MKHFITNCTVGDITAKGEGSGKKTSKKSCAEKMLEELRKLPPIPEQTAPAQRTPNPRGSMRLNKRSIAAVTPVIKKKPRNLIKDIAQKEAMIEDEVTNPISRLLRIQQARKQKDPVYAVIEERGQQRRKEFVMEVTVNGEKAQGFGPNKKIAKRIAAENILIKLGFSKGPETIDTNKLDKSKKVSFKETEKRSNNGGSSGRQLAPGLLLMKNAKSEGKLNLFQRCILCLNNC